MPAAMYPLFRSICLVSLLSTVSLVAASEPVDIGNRRELFTDDLLIGEIVGGVVQQLQLPTPQEVVFETNEPWEGNTSGYYSLFQDADKYIMVYRGWQHDPKMKPTHKEVTCYAESKDGIRWVKPSLGLFEWEGSKDNNIVWLGPGTHNFTAIRDTNPDAPASSRYKALGGGGKGLLFFESADCIHWEQVREQPVITRGAFDSQNLAFWDSHRHEYRAYWRYFGNGIRAIRTARSDDFLNWTDEADLKYTAGTPDEHLYTNAIQKYSRAPHLFVGFPTRYEAKSQQVEPILMTSRDGVTFHRYGEAVVPRTAPKDRNHNRSNYMTWGMFQLPGRPDEISVYATENYYEPTPGRVRRFTYRVDGFVALHAGDQTGSLTTPLLKYQGRRLLLNRVVQPHGHLLLEVLDREGKLVGKSRPITGDAVDAAVEWELDPALHQGVVQLRLTMQNADVFALKFD